MDGYLDKTVVPILKDVKTMWQPSDFLPDSSSPDFLDEVPALLDLLMLFWQRSSARPFLVLCKQEQGSLLLALLHALLSPYVRRHFSSGPWGD